MSDKKNILFVDDEPNVLDGIRRVLRPQRDKWNLFFAESVDDALKILNSNNVDALVSDITMPYKDGFELLNTIKNTEHTKDIPVVMLTGVNEHDIKKRALDMGATDLLNKPADPYELIARINNMLRLKSYQDEIKAHNELLELKVKERTSELAAARIDIIWRLGKAAEYRDTDTGNHVARVGYYSKLIAEALGMRRNFSEMIFLTAPLHDIGKIGIPDNVLLKPAKLNAVEWQIMKRHSEIGANILKQSTIQNKELQTLKTLQCGLDSMKSDNPFLEMASSICFAHHERWDGSGYPGRLTNKQIPIEARIVAVADVYDALFSKRPYKPEFSEEKALLTMRSNNSSHFDPEVFDAFEKSVDLFTDIRSKFADGK